MSDVTARGGVWVVDGSVIPVHPWGKVVLIDTGDRAVPVRDEPESFADDVAESWEVAPA